MNPNKALYASTPPTRRPGSELINYDPGKLLFIRPDDDSKSFAGEHL